MSGTMKPTAARQRDFRKRGDIARSRDAVAAAALAGAVAGLLLSAPASWRAICDLAERACQAAAAASAGEALATLSSRAVAVLVRACAPPLVGALVAALLAIFVQLGWPPALRRREDDGALAPIHRLHQTFGATEMARRAAAAVLKIAAIGLVTALALRPSRSLTSAPQLLDAVVASCGSALVTAALALLALGLADYALAYRRVAARLKMTREDLRREVREQEGDPAIRARRQQQRRELGKQRLAGALATAELVIFARGGAAVALRYRGHDQAPIVIAKGHGPRAAVLIALAQRRSLPVSERPELARALAEVAVGAAIPGALSRAAAEVWAEHLLASEASR
jgi:flagellar biosynthesis protein FlhB